MTNREKLIDANLSLAITHASATRELIRDGRIEDALAEAVVLAQGEVDRLTLLVLEEDIEDAGIDANGCLPLGR